MKKFFTYTKALLIAMMAVMTFTSCEEDDAYDAETLVHGYWQGYLGVYYSNRWHVSGTEYATEMHFTNKGSYYTSGRGYEVDYDTRNPYKNYAYCTFKWFIVDGEITLIYDDDMWNPVYISHYSLYSSRFRGQINDGSGRNIQFDFDNVSSSNWDDRFSGYGRHYDGSFYYSRQSCLDDDEQVPFVDRSAYCVTDDGEQGTSVLSGTFAAMNP